MSHWKTEYLSKIKGLRSLAIPAVIWITTIFSVSVIFVMAYGSSFIYLIGYTNQLLPLF